MTVTEVKGRGTQKGIKLEWRVGEYNVEFLPKIKLAMVVLDKDIDEVIKTICSVCSTGSIGDGKIFVSDVSYVVRIRTGESGAIAI
jgi:nitrogen regulatory protein P-II 1